VIEGGGGARIAVVDLFASLPREPLDLLKMDIEGAEELALRGMSDGLSRSRYRRILLEVHPAILAEHGRTTGDVLNLLLGAGYKGWSIDHSSSAFRRAAYSGSPSPADFLRPLDPEAALDAWPHILWLRPEDDFPL
jgi:hypothetical protein